MRSAPLWQAAEWGLLSWRAPASRRLVGLPSRHRGTVRKVAILKTNCTVCATDRPDHGLHCTVTLGPLVGPLLVLVVESRPPTGRLWVRTLDACPQAAAALAKHTELVRPQSWKRSAVLVYCGRLVVWSALSSRTLCACQVSSRTLRALSNVRRTFRAPEKMVRTDGLIRPRCKEVSKGAG
jgi:hypothetical protein